MQVKEGGSSIPSLCMLGDSFSAGRHSLRVSPLIQDSKLNQLQLEKKKKKLGGKVGCSLVFLGRVLLRENSRWEGRQLWEVGPAWPKAWRWRCASEHRKAQAPQDTCPAHFSLPSGLAHTHLYRAWEGWKFPALPAVGLTKQGVAFEESHYPTHANSKHLECQGPWSTTVI